MAKWILELIVGRSILIVALLAMATAPALGTLKSTQFSPSIVESFVDNRDDYDTAMRMEQQFSGNPDALLWLATDEGTNLFTADRLKAIRSAAAELQELDAVLRVYALPNLDRPSALQLGMRGTTQKIFLNAKLKRGQVPDGQIPRHPILAADASDSSLAAIRSELLNSNEPSRRFLTADAHAHAMLIELRKPYDMDPADQTKLIRQVLDIAESHGLGKQGRYCSGLIALQAYAYEQIGLVLFSYLPIGGVLISIAVMFVFRRIEVVLVTLLIAAVSICWGMALGLAVYGKFSVLMAAVPLMVLVISTADVIHLISSYTAERQQGVSHSEALRKMFTEVGGACILTSVTTFVGFASLVIVPSNTIRQFGFSAAAGVASALLLSVIIIPVFLDRLARWGRPVLSSTSASILSGIVAHRCLQLAIRFPKLVTVTFVVFFLVAGSMACRVSLDPDLTRRFTGNHPISISTQFFATHFGGINSVEIVLRGDPESLMSTPNLRRIGEFAQWCRTQTGVSDVESIQSTLATFLKQLDYRNEQGIPGSAEHALACVAYLRNSRPEIIDTLSTRDMRQVRILVRIQQTSYMQMLAVSSKISQRAKAHFAPEIEAIEKGSAPLIGRAIREIIRGHLQGFVICFSAIFLLITFGLKSLKLGVLSILPNLTPLLFLGGLLALESDVVDSDILAVATLGLGLAVDDTIHFLSRFKIERSASKTVEQALACTMQHTGLAIIRTTFILSVGFAPFALSGYWSINMLGSYLLVVLVAAVLADLIFLPAILVLAYRPRGSTNSYNVSQFHLRAVDD